MCNLYSIRRPRDEVIGLFGISHVDDGVQLELTAVYPDTLVPIIRLDDNGARDLTMMRWSFPRAQLSHRIRQWAEARLFR
jgi:putative SOS response-associated peptidase YedK